MSYESMAKLGDDSIFRDRVGTCCLEQALIFKDDTRREFYMLANQIIQSPASATGLIDLVCVSPNFKEVTDQNEVEDIEILSAVQANWSVLGGIMYPEPDEVPPL